MKLTPKCPPPPQHSHRHTAATRPGRARTADLVLRNGRISTGDPARREAAALAVSDGRITAVGDAGDVAALIGPGTRVVEALGHRVIAGLNAAAPDTPLLVLHLYQSRSLTARPSPRSAQELA